MTLPWKKGRFALVCAAGRGRYLRFFTAIAATLLTVSLQFLTPQIIRVTVDNVIDNQPWQIPGFISSWLESLGGREFLQNNLWLCGTAAGIIALAAGLTNFLRRYFTLEIAEFVAWRFRDTMYAHIQTLPYEWHVKAQTGDIIQRSTSDVDTIRNFFANQFVEIVRAVILLVMAVTLMFLMDVGMTLWSLSLIPIIFVFSMLYFKAVGKQFAKADEAEGALQAAAQENFTGVRVVRAFGRERHEVDKFTEQNGNYSNLWVKIGDLLAFYWSFGDFMSGLQLAVIMGSGILRCAAGDLTVGTFMTFMTYAAMMIWPVRSLGRMIAEMSKAGVSAGRIREVLSAEPERDGEEAVTPEIKGNISFKNVTFGYGGQPVLRGISFDLEAGKTLAVLGATGSGKSTLVHLLTRLYDLPDGAGVIELDGIDIRTIARAHVRKNVGIVLQEPFLYSKTLRENISAPRHGAEHELIAAAARTAHIHDTIETFGQGYDTVVGERGVTLSGGQKQRVAIARTLVADPPIIIFDDSLSAVDTETDARIRDALLTREKRATTVIISHRASTLMQADVILVLRDGGVEEMGSHEQLMARNGSYKRIFDMQGSLEDEMNEITDNG